MCACAIEPCHAMPCHAMPCRAVLSDQHRQYTMEGKPTYVLVPLCACRYAACMHDEGLWHDGCADPAEPRVMGYAMRA